MGDVNCGNPDSLAAPGMRIRTCAACGGTQGGARGGKLLTCNGCLTVSYCGRDCQLAHWLAHKPACKAHQAASATVKHL